MELVAQPAVLSLADTFRISRDTYDTVDVVEVEIRHGGLSGFGEATPTGHYGESVASALAWLEEAAGLLGDDPWAIDEIHARLPSGERASSDAV
jgi:L-alanine-DL-glutamate epimerase-like enolase superfamily enzyme